MLSAHENLNTTIDLQGEIKVLKLNIDRLKHQIKYSVNPATRKTWTNSLNKLILEYNSKVKQYNQLTGKVAKVVARYLALAGESHR